MTLKHDAQGFLIGEGAIHLPAADTRIFRQLTDDVRAVRRLLEARQGKESRQGAAGDGGRASPTKIALPVRNGQAGGAGQAVVTPTGLRIVQSLGGAVIGTPGKAANDETRRLASEIVTQLRRTGQGGKAQPVALPMPVQERARDDRGRFVTGAAPGEPVKPRKEAGQDLQPAGGRDNRGRFTGGDGAGRDERDGEESRLGKVIESLGDKVGNLATVSADAGEVDPNIKAAGEVADVAGKALTGVKTVGTAVMAVAKPLAGRVAGFFGGRPSDAPTPWFRRFFAELRGLRREQSAFNKAELRVLKDIEGKPSEGGKGGMLGMLGGVLMSFMGLVVSAIGAAIAGGFGMLAKLPGLSVLGKLAAAMAPKVPITQPTSGKPFGASVPGGVATEIPGGAAGQAAKKPGMLARAGKGIGGALKRVPLLGAALAAVGIGAGVYESETDDSLSRAEKDKKTGGAVGGGTGAIGGMLAGGAAGAKLGATLGLLGGPVGVAIGTGIGSLVGGIAGGFFGEKAGAIMGEKVGGWVTDIRNADIPGMIGKAWDNTTQLIGKKWDEAMAGFASIWDGAKKAFDDFGAGVTNLFAKFGVDLPAIREKIAQKAGAASDAVVNGAQVAGQWVGEKGAQAKEAFNNSMVGRGVTAVADGLKRVFTREDGSQEVREGGTRAWRNHNPGNIRAGEFAKANGAIGQDADGFAIFGSAEAGAAAKQKLIFEGKNYKDLSLSAAIARYAPPNENDTGKYQRTVLAAVGGQDKRMTDYTPAERSAIVDAMGRMEGFKAGKSTVMQAPVAGVTARATAGAAVTSFPVVPTAAPVVAAAAPVVKPAPQAEVPKVPPVESVEGSATGQLGGALAAASQKPQVVVVPGRELASRDLPDRRIAHIVTGGIVGGS